jgi:hypothetical protein
MNPDCLIQKSQGGWPEAQSLERHLRARARLGTDCREGREVRLDYLDDRLSVPREAPEVEGEAA